jgi:hypothetical protein
MNADTIAVLDRILIAHGRAAASAALALSRWTVGSWRSYNHHRARMGKLYGMHRAILVKTVPDRALWAMIDLKRAR